MVIEKKTVFGNISFLHGEGFSIYGVPMIWCCAASPQELIHIIGVTKQLLVLCFLSLELKDSQEQNNSIDYRVSYLYSSLATLLCYASFCNCSFDLGIEQQIFR